MDKEEYMARRRAIGDETRAKIIEAIREYHKETGLWPSYREIGRISGITSTSVISHHIGVLIGKGVIRKPPVKGAPRCTALIVETAAKIKGWCPRCKYGFTTTTASYPPGVKTDLCPSCYNTQTEWTDSRYLR